MDFLSERLVIKLSSDIRCAVSAVCVSRLPYLVCKQKAKQMIWTRRYGVAVRWLQFRTSFSALNITGEYVIINRKLFQPKHDLYCQLWFLAAPFAADWDPAPLLALNISLMWTKTEPKTLMPFVIKISLSENKTANKTPLKENLEEKLLQGMRGGPFEWTWTFKHHFYARF